MEIRVAAASPVSEPPGERKSASPGREAVLDRPRAAKRTKRDTVPGFERIRPVTLADRAAEAIIAAAAKGFILPGDRIVEAEIARSLGISRVPVREALRLLESQGLVTNEPYRGIRLMRVGAAHLQQVLEVRTALEASAARIILQRAGGRQKLLRQLEYRLADMESKAADADAYAFASADTQFHRELCVLSENQVLCRMWEQLARQLTIIVGLSTLRKRRDAIVEEHRTLLAAFADGEIGAVYRALEEHISTQNAEIDFEGLVAEQRSSDAKKDRRALERSSGAAKRHSI